ncbi:MAG TPA: hypothetical protein VHA75_21260 [Rugosimonospora sp.]|nr:hypothetical protein [Rugosimonospora sp.]
MRSVLAGLRTLTLPWGASNSSARTVIGPDVPAELVAYYNPIGVSSALLFYSFGGANYLYLANLTTPDPNIAIGSVNAGVVREIEAWQYDSFDGINLDAIGLAEPVNILLGNNVRAPSAGEQLIIGSSLGTQINRVLTLLAATGSTIAQEDPANAGTAEPWHGLAYSNGWANAGGTTVPGLYRRVMAPPNSVQIVGRMTPGTKANGTVLATLPAAYRPTNDLDIPVVTDVQAAGQSPHFQIAINGQITCWGLTGAGTASVCGVYPLDTTAPVVITPPTFQGMIASAWTPGTSPKTAVLPVTAGDRIYVMGGSEQDGIVLNTPTDSAGNTYTLVNSVTGTGGLWCGTYVWQAVAATTASITITVTGGTAGHWGFAACHWSGSGGTGDHQVNHFSGTPTIGVTTGQAHSAVFFFSTDWNTINGAARAYLTVNGSTPVPGGAGEIVYNLDANYTVYAAYWPDAGAAGPVTVGLTGPGGQKPGIIGVEVKGL